MPTKPNKRGRDRDKPDKEFQIMIVKIIQNLENKSELQINSLETRSEKMQERFNKGLEEFLPGECQGWGSLAGCHLWGRTESDTTEMT